MKKLLLTRLAGCAATLALVTGLYAQGGKSFHPVQFNKDIFVSAYFAAVAADLKMVPASLVSGSADLSANKFSAKAIRNFGKDFKDASAATWTESNEGYTASFAKNGILSRVNYNKKGKWSSTIRYYGEADLPKNVRHIVKSTFYDYSIFGVTEVSLGDKRAYIVVLEDNKSFKRVKVLDGEMIPIDEMQKSN